MTAPPSASLITEADTAEAAPGNTLWRRLLRRPSFWIGVGLVAAVLVAAIFAPFLAPHNPTTQFDDGISMLGEPLGHTARFPFGTDFEGRDLLSRLLYGARLSLFISLAGNTLSVLLGVTLGTIAGWWRGWIENVIMRVTDVMLAFPALLLAMALVGIRGPSLPIIVIVIALVGWTTLCRITHGEVLSLRERDWVEAAQAMGFGSVRILLRHILPHLLPIVVVYATLGVAITVVFEGSLAYLGLGVPNPTPSWGRMINEGADPNALPYYWLILYPSAAIFMTVLGFSLLGDALRDALDPRS